MENMHEYLIGIFLFFYWFSVIALGSISLKKENRRENKYFVNRKVYNFIIKYVNNCFFSEASQLGAHLSPAQPLHPRVQARNHQI